MQGPKRFLLTHILLSLVLTLACSASAQVRQLTSIDELRAYMQSQHFSRESIAELSESFSNLQNHDSMVMSVWAEPLLSDSASIMKSLINNGDLIPTARFEELTGVDTLTVDNFPQVAESLWDTSEIALWKRVEGEGEEERELTEQELADYISNQEKSGKRYVKFIERRSKDIQRGTIHEDMITKSIDLFNEYKDTVPQNRESLRSLLVAVTSLQFHNDLNPENKRFKFAHKKSSANLSSEAVKFALLTGSLPNNTNVLGVEVLSQFPEISNTVIYKFLKDADNTQIAEQTGLNNISDASQNSLAVLERNINSFQKKQQRLLANIDLDKKMEQVNMKHEQVNMKHEQVNMKHEQVNMKHEQVKEGLFIAQKISSYSQRSDDIFDKIGRFIRGENIDVKNDYTELVAIREEVQNLYENYSAKGKDENLDVLVQKFLGSINTLESEYKKKAKRIISKEKVK